MCYKWIGSISSYVHIHTGIEAKMRYLPVGLDIRKRRCVVVGGGQVGTRKVTKLTQAGGSVVLVSPEVTPELEGLAEEGQILWRREEYGPVHLDGAFLAVAATDNQELNQCVVADAKVRGIMVCDASSAERSGVIFGAIHIEDGVTVAVFTDGEDPSRARTTRDSVATFLAGDEDTEC